MIIDLFVIGLIAVLLIDIIGAIDEIYNAGLRLIFGSAKPYIRLGKPFSCSLCMTFWIGIIYLLIYGCFSLYMLLFVIVNAYLTSTYYNVILTIKIALDKLISFINTKL